MIDSVIVFVDEFRRTFRIVDAIDVLLVSVFLYAGLVWFKQAASRGVLVGVIALAIIYVFARAMDMFLTSLAFHTTFAALLFILIVVFQEDLRRMFERVSSLNPSKLRQISQVTINLDELIEASFNMAKSKTGALIVLKGSEPLDRHLEGGISLGGRMSAPLLRSIFDDGSPGHDGAVIIENDRIVRFAVHLPISKNHSAIAGRGTRHSAALGLSERSDALTIVVSEERGVLSVSESGKLKEMKSAPALKSRLESFYAEKFPRTDQSVWKRFVLQHGFLKLIAIAVAIVAWFVLAYDPNTIQRTFVVPIEYHNLPRQFELDEFAPVEARVTLSGSERSFRFLDPGSLKIRADMTDARAGRQEIPVSASSIRVPMNLDIYRIEPRVIRLNLRPIDSAAMRRATSRRTLLTR